MENKPNERAVGDRELEKARDLLYAKIFPNTPRTPEECQAFEKAVIYQAEADAFLHDAYEGLPKHVTSFHTGNFSVSMEPRTGYELCPEAYGVLLRAGLLYKGVEREMDHPPERVVIGYTSAYYGGERVDISPVHPGVEVRRVHGKPWRDD